MPLESSITNSILGYLNSLPYCRAEKVKGSSSSSGRADVNACYKGRCIRIEVKTPDHKNKASAKQEHNLEKWSNAGAVIMVAYSRSSVEKLIYHLDHKDVVNFTTLYLYERNGCISWFTIPKVRQ